MGLSKKIKRIAKKAQVIGNGSVKIAQSAGTLLNKDFNFQNLQKSGISLYQSVQQGAKDFLPAINGMVSGDASGAFEIANDFASESKKYETTDYEVTDTGWKPAVNVKGASETSVATSTLVMGAIGLIVLAKLAGGKN